MISARNRIAGEIIPVSAEHSATKSNSDLSYGAGKAIDLAQSTASQTVSGSYRYPWLKLNLDKVHCVHQVITYFNNGKPSETWTCTNSDCSNCEGSYCRRYTLTVRTNKAVSDLPPVSDCKYGDKVKLERVVAGDLKVYEIAVVGKPGKF